MNDFTIKIAFSGTFPDNYFTTSFLTFVKKKRQIKSSTAVANQRKKNRLFI